MHNIPTIHQTIRLAIQAVAAMKSPVRQQVLARLTQAGIVGIVISALILPSYSLAHSGGLAADGCHRDRKNGGRHCHRSPSYQSPRIPSRPQTRHTNDDFQYRNCTAARAAGDAPVRRGEYGYGPHLDGDGDGIGCE